MKNPFRALFDIVTGPSRPLPPAPPPSPPSAEVRAAELAAPEAARLEQDAARGLEQARIARADAHKALEAAEDAAAASPDAAHVLEALEAAQRKASLAAGVERSAERKLDAARAARERADGRLDGSRADAARLAANARIRSAATNVESARAAYQAAAPAQKIATLATQCQAAMTAALDKLAASRVEVLAALAAAEEADARALAAEPHRAEEIRDAAEERRLDGLEVLRNLGCSERWYDQAAEPAEALIVLAAELQRMAIAMLETTNAEAYAAGQAVKELGGAGEWIPMGDKHAKGAAVFARLLAMPEADRKAVLDRGLRGMGAQVAEAAGGYIHVNAWGPDLGSSTYSPGHRLDAEATARLVLRHPSARPGPELEAAGHKRALEKGDMKALEYEAAKTGIVDPRLEAHREQQRREEADRQERLEQSRNASPGRAIYFRREPSAPAGPVDPAA
jgi:hypothetical protein